MPNREAQVGLGDDGLFLSVVTTGQAGHADAGTTLFLLTCVAALGLALGSWRIKGIGLGSTGALFAGLALGCFTAPIDPIVLHFVREFGLMLFVFTMGMQLGPGFIASLRADGLSLNLLAVGIVTGGALLTCMLGGIFDLDPGSIPGLFSGATTNTPSLGAIQQAMASIESIDLEQRTMPAVSYSAVYPVGILGIILSIMTLKRLWKINPAAEARRLADERRSRAAPLERLNVKVENINLDGLKLKNLPGTAELHVNISRIMRSGANEAVNATEEETIRCGDVVLAVGTPEQLDQFRLIVGSVSDQDLMKAAGPLTFRRIVVTRKTLLGRPLRELGLDHRFGVTITRIVRAGVEMPATGRHRLQYGDFLHIVGAPANLNDAEKELGNSLKDLNTTHFLPVFLGLALGALLGMKPLPIPGLSSPLKLGLAGGPLIMAMLLSRIGRLGPLVWHMPLSTNLAFRELGIILFLAAVGIGSGPKFFAAVFSPTGLLWAGCALCIAMVPLLIAGWFARRFLKLNFLAISGLLSGSMTDPPALAFVGNMAESEEPALAYATVYPTTMLSRIVAAQLIVLLFFS